jgi:hypothetical protein
MPKKKAPVQVTGGGGFRYENSAAARFLLDLLSGTNSLGAEFGRVTRVDWQARDTGWLADDLVITCAHPDGERTAGVSVKSAQQVTAGGFPKDFVEIAWAQWFGSGTNRKLSGGDDSIVLIVGSMAHDVEDAWSSFLRDALKTTPARMAARLSETDPGAGVQSSALQRALVANFACPEALRGEGQHDDNAKIELLRRVRLLYFDYDKTPSREHARALDDCQRILRSGDAADAARLWQKLTGIADEKRTGGSIDLPQLLARLRGEFELREHPDYRRDCEVLDCASQEAMADVHTEIAGLPPLTRAGERTRVQSRLDQNAACFLVGDSGSGKSALAKAIAAASYPRVVWLGPHNLDCETPADFERSLGINRPLSDILNATAERCLVVFDGVERFDLRAIRLTCRLIADIHADGAAPHVHFLLTAQFEAANQLVRRFVEFAAPESLREPVPITPPSLTDVQSLVSAVPGLQWASLRPELRPLLRNLKVLDWLVSALRAGANINAPAFTGITQLIDALWERWVEADRDGPSRSHLLMHLGILEAETLSPGVPRMRLEHAEQSALPGMTVADLIRVRDERVRFAHDLLGDWARLRVLIGEQSLATPANRERAALPRWHRAVRLFGQRLLEQTTDGTDRWRQAIEALQDETQEGKVISDVLLESAFLASNADDLLERTWPALAANGGRLLNRLLNRFLFVATLPDRRVVALIEGVFDDGQWEHLFRIPYWPYWAPVLRLLHAHRAEVAQLVPVTAAKVSSLWLRSMPTELGGEPMPLRREAAELAVAIAREVQALNEEGNYYGGGHDYTTYEAALWAAPDLSDEVSALCLELAKRRELNPEIRQRVEQTHARRREERRQYLADHPERERAPAPIGWPHGPRRDPWPDGPRDGVDHDFQKACLDSGAFIALVRANPDVALEVLLAVCIEDPQHEDYSSHPRREHGVDYWQAGEPAFFARGPFLPFLRERPDQGLSFVLKLVNFATRRYSDQAEALDVVVGNQPRRWFGDSNVFRWHFEGPHMHGTIVHCALMALERWLYEQIDRGEAVDVRIARILAESESLAFAGLLFDVGKRLPGLFSGPLKPLLQSWVLVKWDWEVTQLRHHDTLFPGFWGRESPRIIAVAREWFTMPHRRDMLAGLGGGIIQTMMGDEENYPFLDGLRVQWAGGLNAEGEPETLRLLIERFNPANYTFEVRDGRRVPVDFQWPEAIARKNAEDRQRIGRDQTLTTLPFKCRERLNASAALPQEQLLWLWQFLQEIDANPPDLGGHDGEALIHIEDILCGGIALLVILHHDWLNENPERMAWCHRKLETIVAQPPAPLRFDSEGAPGERQWDAFAAEAGVFLLSRNRGDRLARQLVALGVTSFHYSTTALTLLRASQRREVLGDDFDRLLGMAVRWAGLRVPYALATRAHEETLTVELATRKAALAEEFVERRLPAELPDIRQIDAAAAEECDAVYARQFPESARSHRRADRLRHREGSVEKFYPRQLRLDAHVISSAFAWLNLQSARPGDERWKWLGFIRLFLGLVLESVPHIDDPRNQEIDGLPSEFDGWVFGIVAGAVPCLTPAEDPGSLWKPILELGTPAHQWVERFFWYWFTDGLRPVQSAEQFTALWSAMIEHALACPSWQTGGRGSFHLDQMVFELLGFNSGMHTVGKNTALASAIGAMEPVFARAAQQWFRMPRVTAGFLHFAVQPATAGLMLPAIRWLAAVVPSYDSYDWKDGLEDNLIAFMHACWERHHQTISADATLEKLFLGLLATLVSRGGHAAIALRDRIIGSAAA